MAYTKSRLVARSGYSGGLGKAALGGSVSDFFSGLFGGISSSAQQQQAASAAAAQYAASQGGGISFIDVALVGGVGVAAWMLLRKKKAA